MFDNFFFLDTIFFF